MEEARQAARASIAEREKAQAVNGRISVTVDGSSSSSSGNSSGSSGTKKSGVKINDGTGKVTTGVETDNDLSGYGEGGLNLR